MKKKRIDLLVVQGCVDMRVGDIIVVKKWVERRKRGIRWLVLQENGWYCGSLVQQKFFGIYEDFFNEDF